MEGIATRAVKLFWGRNMWFGAGIGAASAAATGLLSAGHPWKIWVPLVFTLVLLWIALFFGAQAGILSTWLAALVFALFVLHAPGSVRIAEGPARANLAWMLLIGTAFSFLFAPSSGGLGRHSHNQHTTHSG